MTCTGGGVYQLLLRLPFLSRWPPPPGSKSSNSSISTPPWPQFPKQPSLSPLSISPLIDTPNPFLCCAIGGTNNNNNYYYYYGGGGGGGGGNGGGWRTNPFDPRDEPNPENRATVGWLLFLLSLLSFASSAAAAASAVWEVRGGKRTRLVLNDGDALVLGGEGSDADILASSSNSYSNSMVGFLERCWLDVIVRLMLPEGYPNSVSSDYLQYSLWRGVQGIASQISAVLSTQALLYAVGLGKGAIPTAAAVNWVLKDGIGYLSKILLSKYGRHFDVHPKGWRLFADLLENVAYGMEIMTPAFPHLFVFIGAAAGAGRSAAALIQAATRSCFYAGFAVQRNFAEVIAKGEAQGMVSKFLGIMLGIALANRIGSSMPLALASFGAVTVVHMYCNFKSYQSIHLRTLNPYRACLVFSEYLLSGEIPSIREVNDEEPLFSGTPNLHLSTHLSEILSPEAIDAAAQICRRLRLGSKLSEMVHNKEDALALFDLYYDEGYLLLDNKGEFCVVLKKSSTPQDMLKSIFHVNYLYWLEKNVGLKPRSTAEDCKTGGILQMSLEYVKREFGHVKDDGSQTGWVMDGLIARPLPNRIQPVYTDSSS